MLSKRNFKPITTILPVVRLPRCREVFLCCAILLVWLPNLLNGQSRTGCLPAHRFWDQDHYCQVASKKHFSIRETDEVWWVTSRNISGQLDSLDEVPTLEYAMDSSGRRSWQVRDAAELIARHNQTNDLVTMFYVHGNRTNPNWSLNRGIQVYENIYCNCKQRRPIRFVIWHWPADENKLRIQEFDDNSRRAIIHGRHFARYLQYYDSRQELGLVGYSLGAQFLLSTSQQIADFVDQGSVTAQSWQESQLRMAFIAPVAACDWPRCNHQLEQASRVIGQVVSFENQKDHALAIYRLKCGSQNPKGLSPLHSLRRLNCFDSKVQTYEVGHLAGSKHSIAKYVRPEFIQSSIRGYFGLTIDPAEPCCRQLQPHTQFNHDLQPQPESTLQLER